MLNTGIAIRICPDWNVKVFFVPLRAACQTIRICPDWNVKKQGHSLVLPDPAIRICPDWNVKTNGSGACFITSLY